MPRRAVGAGAGHGVPCTGKARQPRGPPRMSHCSTPAKTDATAASLPAAPPRHPPRAHPEPRPAPCWDPSTAAPQPARPRQGPPWAQSSSLCPQPHGDSPKPSTVGVHHGQTSSHLQPVEAKTHCASSPLPRAVLAHLQSSLRSLPPGPGSRTRCRTALPSLPAGSKRPAAGARPSPLPP